MKKVALSALVTGFLIGAGSAQAGTLEFTDSIDMDVNWLDNEPLTLEVSKYNRSEKLLSIFVEVNSNVIGTYTLASTKKQGNVQYGLTSDDVGAFVKIFGPSQSISLNPTPKQDIGSGTIAPKQSINIDISGSDTKSNLIDESFFNLFTGVGNVVFNASAISNSVVSKTSGSSEAFDIQADARLRIVYEYEDAPPPSVDIPEPGMLAGLLAFGSLGLAANRRQAS
jgi:hypothetical protein